ncbi:MAG: GGDEF domain-containing protein [Halopseudomonas sp.]|uniref:GGDEF domain-containing protein n=1 Tax=Halopseudomonas sp. TaxID=2901191 RepID=UPI0030024005
MHHFLLLFVPTLFISMRMRSAWILFAGMWLYYVALDVLMWYMEPLQPISSHALLALQVFNLSVVFGMFGYLSQFYVSSVTRAHKRLDSMATVDSLTGLFNRGHIIALSEKELARHHRHPTDLIFMLMDLDHFKQINDRYGHNAGDQVLSEVSQLLADSIGKQSYVGRWGGEEFIAVMPATDIDQSIASAERIRKGVESLAIDVDGERIKVTISIGITQYRAEELLSNAIARADQALYQSKGAGRNRVEVASG